MMFGLDLHCWVLLLSGLAPVARWVRMAWRAM